MNIHRIPTELLIEMKADAEYMVEIDQDIKGIDAALKALGEEPTSGLRDIIDHLWHADAPVRRGKISAWFDTLPEPQRSKAKVNTTGWMLGKEVNSLAEALTEGFNWRNSKEGHDYWYAIISKLDNI